MSQTLTILPAITTPVTMLQNKTLSANVAAIQNLSNREVMALMVISKIHQLSATGTDYRLNHKQLRTDATAFMGGFSWENFPPGGTMMNRIQAVLAWNAGRAADATLSTDVNVLEAEMAGMRETPETTLWTFYFFLLYKLAV